MPIPTGPVPIDGNILNVLRGEGDVVAFRRQSDPSIIGLKAMVEFSDIDVAIQAINTWNGKHVFSVGSASLD